MDEREFLKDTKRVVVKIGTKLLVPSGGKPDRRRMQRLVKEVSALQKSGKEVVLVSSGAIGAGMESLRMKRRPKTLPELQMAAAVGQAKLVEEYAKFFAKERIKVGQVLLMHNDLDDRLRHLNARNAMMAMLRRKIIPIVNENDVVSVDEIKFGDNDYLAALVSLLVNADALVMLTTVNGFRQKTKSGKTKRLSYARRITKKMLSQATGTKNEVSTGGMLSKLESASTLVKAGRAVVIADGRKPGVLKNIFASEDVGTLLGGNIESKNLPSKKRWIAFFNRIQGSIVIDSGAVRAILKRGNSLLPVGVKKANGEFGAGALVSICTPKGKVIAKGLAEYSSEEINIIRGKKTSEIANLLGSRNYDEIIHCDNMVILGKDE